MRRAVPAFAVAVLATGLCAAAVPSPSRHAYMILPFENTSEDPSLDWLSSGLAHALGEYLQGFGQLVMEDDERSVLLEGSGIPSGAPLTLATALELGRKTLQRPSGLRTDRLGLGRFSVNQGEITLSARIIDLPSEKARPWLTRSGGLKDLLAKERDLALALARDEKIAIPEGRAAVLRQQSEDAPLLAFETYSRAMAESDSKKRLQLLRKALQQYPGYPKAAYQSGEILAREERWEEAATVLARASSDPFPYEADFHLLNALVSLKRKDAATAATEARRALELSDTPRGHLLLGRALQAGGDRAGAQSELDKARAAGTSDAEIEDLRRALDDTKTERRTP